MTTLRMEPAALLRAREDIELPRRFARSTALIGAGVGMPTEGFADWFAARTQAHQFRVDRIPFDALQGWSFTPETGNLAHDSGRFFTVEGLRVTDGDGLFPEWDQPIIVQPEVGILGILAKEFDGVLHFLMQAKMEPGNPNLLQLSPTVQATRSNYTKVHRGTNVKYLEYFTDRRLGRVLVDSLQSEHGAWFYLKSNRNMIVEAYGDVPVDDDFQWFTLGQLGEFLRRDNVVNMDARTVLACVPSAQAEVGALHSDTDLLSWFTAERSRHDVRVRRVPLARLENWLRGSTAIGHALNRYFRVIAVSVAAGNREVSSWTQPLFEPCACGVVAFVTRRFHGVPHLLVHARVEAGFRDTVELGPTVQYTPENYAHLPAASRPMFHDLVTDHDRARIRYDAVHAEEGGRFFHAVSRYLIVEADEDQAPTQPPPGYLWVTPGQLSSLVRHGRYLNVQARTLLSIVNMRAVNL